MLVQAQQAQPHGHKQPVSPPEVPESFCKFEGGNFGSWGDCWVKRDTSAQWETGLL